MRLLFAQVHSHRGTGVLSADPRESGVF
jgi:hypothetical protein